MKFGERRSGEEGGEQSILKRGRDVDRSIERRDDRRGVMRSRTGEGSVPRAEAGTMGMTETDGESAAVDRSIASEADGVRLSDRRKRGVRRTLAGVSDRERHAALFIRAVGFKDGI